MGLQGTTCAEARRVQVLPLLAGSRCHDLQFINQQTNTHFSCLYDETPALSSTLAELGMVSRRWPDAARLANRDMSFIPLASTRCLWWYFGLMEKYSVPEQVHTTTVFTPPLNQGRSAAGYRQANVIRSCQCVETITMGHSKLYHRVSRRVDKCCLYHLQYAECFTEPFNGPSTPIQ